MNLLCPICGREDAVRCKDESRFHRDGRLTAICFHGHGNGRPVTFDAETGQPLKHEAPAPHELLYQLLEAEGARGFGAAFLAEHCGIYAVTKDALDRVRPARPTERDLIRAQQQEGVLTAAPLYRGARMVGLEVRIVEVKSIGKVTKWTRVLGEDGVYIANPRVQPSAVIVSEGTWDAVSMAWDALEHDEAHRYAFLSIKAGTKPQVLQETLEAHFPGVPVLLVTDQDSAGKGARVRLAHLATPAVLPGVGLAKDYREADPKRRWDALLEAIERALEAQPAGEEHGTAKIARRVLDGTVEARMRGLQVLEAWRFGQRCGGICKASSGGKKFFSIRARIHGRLPVAEGLHDFSAILLHRGMRRIRADFPDLAAAIEAGPTESPMSPEWTPPAFLPDGRHWSEIPSGDRLSVARNQGWEPWKGKAPGGMTPDDLERFLDQMRGAYAFVRIPGVPDSEVGSRVAVVCLAVALMAFWAEERWQASLPVGFLQACWFFGGAATGKGTAAKVIAAAITGELRTYGSQRFDGQSEGGWLTESVLHLPVCFRDELDTFLQRQELEDLKTYLAGEPLQLRKKFGTDMTIPPKPVVFSSNSLKINADDEATKERIVLVRLEPNPLADKTSRNGAFAALYAWLEGEGSDLVHRLALGLYKTFRQAQLLAKPRWTRSLAFDSALLHVAKAAGYDPDEVMQAFQEQKERAVIEGTPWFRALQDYIENELAGAERHEAKVVDVWGIDAKEPAGRMKLGRWLPQLIGAAKGGGLEAGGFAVSLSPMGPNTRRLFVFRAIAEATHEA